MTIGERSRGWLLACGVAFAAWSCANTEAPAPDYGSESHWLDACAYDSDCGSLRCVCNTCTRGCVSDDGCGERRDAICVNAESPLLQRRCEGQSLGGSDAVCIARCTGDGDCPSGTGCVSGACVPLLSTPDAGPPPVSIDASVPVAPPDAAVTMPVDAGDPIRDRIDDLAALDASVSFGDPVDVPDAEVVIEGGDDHLVGTWKQATCDPNRELCAFLSIYRNDAGAVVGMLGFEQLGSEPGWVMEDPIDPERGYPPGLSVTEYESLRQLPRAGIAYRILDGHWNGTRLRFTWSPLDLWQDWCAAQTAYPWKVGDRTTLQCVPQDPDELAAIDQQKVLLCRHQSSAAGVPSCDTQPAACCDLGFAGDCPSPYCRCDAQGCQADVALFRLSVDLALEGARLVGTLRKHVEDVQPDGAGFERVGP